MIKVRVSSIKNVRNSLWTFLKKFSWGLFDRKSSTICPCNLLSFISICNVTLPSVSVSVEEEKSGDGGFDYLESPVSDGTIEENFEEELVNAPISGPYSIINSANEYDEDEDFSDVSQYGIVEVVGDDTYGRKIITVTACKLPNNNQLDHQRLLRYYHTHIFFRNNSHNSSIALRKCEKPKARILCSASRYAISESIDFSFSFWASFIVS